MFACKLAATGFKGVELNELNLSLNEVAETPLDSIALPSSIFALCSLRGSYSRSYAVDLVFVRCTPDGESKTSNAGWGSGWAQESGGGSGGNRSITCDRPRRDEHHSGDKRPPSARLSRRSRYLSPRIPLPLKTQPHQFASTRGYAIRKAYHQPVERVGRWAIIPTPLCVRLVA